MIIWLEDDPFWISTFKSELEKASNDTIEICLTPDIFFEKLENAELLKSVKLIILDIQMASGKIISAAKTNGGTNTGLIVLQKIQKEIKKLNIPIIIWTIREDAEVKHAAENFKSHFFSKTDKYTEVKSTIEGIYAE